MRVILTGQTSVIRQGSRDLVFSSDIGDCIQMIQQTKLNIKDRKEYLCHKLRPHSLQVDKCCRTLSKIHIVKRDGAFSDFSLRKQRNFVTSSALLIESFLTIQVCILGYCFMIHIIYEIVFTFHLFVIDFANPYVANLL